VRLGGIGVLSSDMRRLGLWGYSRAVDLSLRLLRRVASVRSHFDEKQASCNAVLRFSIVSFRCSTNHFPNVLSAELERLTSLHAHDRIRWTGAGTHLILFVAEREHAILLWN
jgi:hypothetical protein